MFSGAWSVPQLEVPGVDPAVIRELVGSPRLVALGDGPSFSDHVAAFATHEELAPFFEEDTQRAMLEHGGWSSDSVIARLSEVPFEASMLWAGWIQRQLWGTAMVGAGQVPLVYEVYGADSPVARASQRLLETNSHMAAITEQQLFALQRLLVLHARESPDTLTNDDVESLRMALFLIPDTVLTDEVEEAGLDHAGVLDERWLRIFIAHGGLLRGGSVAHEIARQHRMFNVIRKSSWARHHHDFCDLDAWFTDVFGIDFEETQALGFALYAGARVANLDEPPLRVTPSYFDTTLLRSRIDRALDAVTADRADFRTRFAENQHSPRHAAWEIAPFLRRPGLRMGDGSVMVVAPRALETWMSPAGSYFRCVDIARDERSDADVEQFQRFHGLLFERYVRHLAHVAHPRRTSSTGMWLPGAVYGESPYGPKKRRQLTSDVAIDLGQDLVLVEAVGKRLTQVSLVAGDEDAIRDDLRRLIIEKVNQLGRVIRDIASGTAQIAGDDRLPGVNLAEVTTVWPLLVMPDTILQTPVLWQHIRAGGYALDGIEGVVTKPLTLLDAQEYELLMALDRQGTPLLGMLASKTEPAWRDRDFKAWLIQTEHREARSDFIKQELNRAFRCQVHRLIDFSHPHNRRHRRHGD